MDFLRKNVLFFLIVFFATFAYGQSTKEIINAFNESYTLESSGKYSDAITKLKSVYKGDSYELNLRLGWLNYQVGLFNDSKAYYNKAIKLKPYAIEPKFGLAYPVSALGSWNEVLNIYDAILEIDPNNTTAHYKIGLIYYGKEDFKTAETHFEKVINLYPFDYHSLLMLGWTKFKLQEFGKAKVLFNKVLLYSPDDESAQKGLDAIE